MQPTSSTRKPRASSQARIAAILDAARGLLADEGIGGLTIYSVAERAEMPPSSVYHFFPSVPALLEAMEREVSLGRIGACGILARLADVLAASIIRAWVECGCSDSTGWIAAVRCPKIGKVIAAIHADPEGDWSVPVLADLMGASRSRFAEAFTRTMGESPARYVAKIKMFQARRWIADDGMRIAVAADRLGYDSEASFSRAFKRIIGHPPSASRHGQALATVD